MIMVPGLFHTVVIGQQQQKINKKKVNLTFEGRVSSSASSQHEHFTQKTLNAYHEQSKSVFKHQNLSRLEPLALAGFNSVS